LTADANAITDRFRKIMGPVATTLAKEAAKECGGTVSGEKVSVDGKKLETFKQLMKQKCGKIIGEHLAETILKEE
jgi:translation initiation factor 1 (eIF-1/SUI1)